MILPLGGAEKVIYGISNDDHGISGKMMLYVCILDGLADG